MITCQVTSLSLSVLAHKMGRRDPPPPWGVLGTQWRVLIKLEGDIWSGVAQLDVSFGGIPRPPWTDPMDLLELTVVSLSLVFPSVEWDNNSTCLSELRTVPGTERTDKNAVSSPRPPSAQRLRVRWDGDSYICVALASRGDARFPVSPRVKVGFWPPRRQSPGFAARGASDGSSCVEVSDA